MSYESFTTKLDLGDGLETVEIEVSNATLNITKINRVGQTHNLLDSITEEQLSAANAAVDNWLESYEDDDADDGEDDLDDEDEKE